MPYVSQAQAGYFHIHKKQLAKQGVSVAEWDKASKGKKLPKHVKSKTSSGPKTKHFKEATGGFKEPKVVQKNLTGKVGKIK